MTMQTQREIQEVYLMAIFHLAIIPTDNICKKSTQQLFQLH